MTPVVNVGAGPSWHERRRTRKDGQPYKRNLWHVTLMTAYSDAAWSWWQLREQTTHGHLGGEEEAAFRRDHACPLLRDFMVALSRDWQHRDDAIAS